MRFTARAPKNVKRFVLSVAAALLVLAIAGPVAPVAAAPASTTSPSLAQDATTVPSAATTTPTTLTGAPTTVTAPTATTVPAGASSTTPTSAPATPGATTAVVPPASGFAPLNPGWKVDQMGIQIWPEYDQNAVLVLMTFTLPADVQLPATFKFTVPRGAQIAGIGEVDPNGQFRYNYANSYPPVQPGTEWDTVTIQVKDYKLLQVDYYYNPGLPTGAGDRLFPVLFQSPVDVGTLNLHVQQPSRATNFAAQPELQGSGKAQDGFTYSVASFTDVKAGSTLGEVISYTKPDGNPSVGATQDAAPAKLRTSTVLLAAILIIVVCVGGLVIYLMYRNTGKAKRAAKAGRLSRGVASRGAAVASRPSSSARQPAVRQKAAPKGRISAAVGAEDDVPANTEADSPADSSPQPSTAFCVSCGEELGPKNRFCPNCGEAVDS